MSKDEIEKETNLIVPETGSHDQSINKECRKCFGINEEVNKKLS